MEDETLNFNKQQKEAILHKDGVCSVIAGAGAGKTAVLINRVKELIDSGICESEILVVSFTSDIAKELNKKLSDNGLKNVYAGTFHAIARNMLFKNGICINPKEIISEWKIEECFKRVNRNVKLKKYQIFEIKSFIDFQKVYLKSYNDKFIHKECSIDEEDLRIYFKTYETFKKENKLYDFTDWLLMCYEIVKKKPCEYKYVLVDEHQDNNYIRNLLLKEWARHGNIFYVGDYRQSIYAFNGAIPEMFMDLDKQWNNVKVINMDINYRSCKNIVDNANKFIKPYYKDYKYYSDSIANNKNNGHIETFTYYLKTDEGKEIANKIEELIKNGENENDIAVLYRNNSHADYIESELKQKGIKYYISENKGFFDRKETKLIVSYLKLLENPHNDENFDILFNLRNHPIMYIKKKDYEEIKHISGKKNTSLYESFITYKFSDIRDIKSVKEFKNNIEWLRLQKDKTEVDLSKLIDNIVKTFDINNYIEENFELEEIEGRKNSIIVLKNFSKGNTLKSFIRFISGGNEYKKDNQGIKLLTIHASKGLEFKHVFVISIEDGKFPSDKANILEEVRLFYVAITRSKENLYLSQIGNNNRFVNEYNSIYN